MEHSVRLGLYCRVRGPVEHETEAEIDVVFSWRELARSYRYWRDNKRTNSSATYLTEQQ